MSGGSRKRAERDLTKPFCFSLLYLYIQPHFLFLPVLIIPLLHYCLFQDENSLLNIRHIYLIHSQTPDYTNVSLITAVIMIAI